MSDEIQWTPDQLTEMENPWEDTQYSNLPRALAKACEDNQWQYAVGLRDGTVLEFQGARYDGGEWIHLSFYFDYTDSTGVWRCEPRRNPIARVEMNFDRGLDVRLSDIMWAADAPHGS